MPSIIVHGLPNCDTVRRARAWLDVEGLAYRFHDWRRDGVPAALDGWLAAPGWQKLLNRQGSTWRKLDAAAQAGVTDAASAGALMRAQPSLIRRPVVDWGDGQVTVGFDAEAWRAAATARAGTGG